MLTKLYISNFLELNLDNDIPHTSDPIIKPAYTRDPSIPKNKS